MTEQISNNFTERDLLITAITKLDYLTQLLEHMVETTRSLPGHPNPSEMMKKALDNVAKGISGMQSLDDRMKRQLSETFKAFQPVLSSMLPFEGVEKDDN